jgi:predicted porin
MPTGPERPARAEDRCSQHLPHQQQPPGRPRLRETSRSLKEEMMTTQRVQLSVLAALIVSLTPSSARADAPILADHIWIYGRIHLSVESALVGGPTAKSHDQVVNNVSRIGFKGEEKINDDFKAFWQVESGVPVADGQGGGSNQLAGRESFVGILTPLGSIRGGNYYDAWDDLHGIGGNAWQYWAGTTNDATLWSNGAVAATGGFDERSHNTIGYTSPVFDGALKGLRIRANWSLAPGGTPLPNGAQSVQGGSYSLAAHLYYENGPLLAGLGHRTNRKMAQSTTTASVTGATPFFDTSSGTELAVSYRFFNALTLAGVAELDQMVNVNATGKDRSRFYWSALVRYAVENDHLFSVMYGSAGAWTGDAKRGSDGAYQASVAYNYVLSKLSQAYLAYSALHNDTNGYYLLGGNPARAASTTAAPSPDWTIQARDQHAIVLGMWVNF